MKRSFLFLFVSLSGLLSLQAQGVAVNNTATPANSSAMLDISSNQKGLLIPRLKTVERDAVSLPATALLIFNTDLLQFQVNVGTPAKPDWQSIVSLSQPDASKLFWTTGIHRYRAQAK